MNRQRNKQLPRSCNFTKMYTNARATRSSQMHRAVISGFIKFARVTFTRKLVVFSAGSGDSTIRCKIIKALIVWKNPLNLRGFSSKMTLSSEELKSGKQIGSPPLVCASLINVFIADSQGIQRVGQMYRQIPVSPLGPFHQKLLVLLQLR